MKEIIIKISCIIGLIGFYILVGTAGASDLDLICMKEIIGRGGVGIGLLLAGYGGFKLGGSRYVR